MSRKHRAAIARETLRYASTYPVPTSTTLFTKELNDILDQPLTTQDEDTYFEVYYGDVIDSIHYTRENFSTPIGVLNFASARNPGGGFLKGSVAQEEALCLASNLYPALEGSLMYTHNNKNPVDGLYQDIAIYTSQALFFRDANHNILTIPTHADVLTMPAVNAGHARDSRVPEETIRETMVRRIELSLAIFAEKGCKSIILGAYGCGVFKNDPWFVAKAYYNLLTTKYKNVFEYVNFSTYGAKECSTFEKVFKKLC